MSRPLGVLLLVMIALPWQGARRTACAQEKFWTVSAYKMHIAVAVDDRRRPAPASAEELARYLTDRIDATLHPLWQADVAVVEPDQIDAEAGGLSQRDYEAIPAALRKYDKLQTLLLESTPTAWRLKCREYDLYARRWGALEERPVRQGAFLKEHCFQALLEIFAPLAIVDGDRETPDRVQLTFRGANLPRRADEAVFVKTGQVFLPLLRRMNRTGELVGGIPAVPWTYLTATEPIEQEQGAWSAKVDSGIRRPFGVRRRGRVQELAIAVRPSKQPTEIVFHARSDRSRRLAGYEIHRRIGAEKQTDLLGVTDAQGKYVVEAGGEGVVTLFLRSEGQLLAKLPVLPGARAVVEVPIADDPIRLRAQAQLTVIREQLVDLVAQRAILIARARAALEQDDVARAQSLVDELSNLPSRSIFDQKIAAAERSANVDELEDAQVREKIEKMFVDTRNLLGRFLDSRPISQLQIAVTQAQSQQ